MRNVQISENLEGQVRDQFHEVPLLRGDSSQQRELSHEAIEAIEGLAPALREPCQNLGLVEMEE